MAAAQGTTRLTAAGVQALLAASGATLSSNASIFTVRVYTWTTAIKHICKNYQVAWAVLPINMFVFSSCDVTAGSCHMQLHHHSA
jgi:hypothetical protein